LSKADIVFILILCLGGFLGYRRGFLMELFFLAALVLGVFIGFKLMGVGMEYLAREFNANKTVLPYLSFAIIFVVVVILVILVGRSIKNSVDKTFLGRMDSIVGAILGVLKYAFCLSVLVWLAKSFHYQFPDSWTRDSYVFPLVGGFAPRIAGFLGGFLPFFKEIFHPF
jgi:membrane protein required for colicin V production